MASKKNVNALTAWSAPLLLALWIGAAVVGPLLFWGTYDFFAWVIGVGWTTFYVFVGLSGAFLVGAPMGWALEDQFKTETARRRALGTLNVLSGVPAFAVALGWATAGGGLGGLFPALALAYVPQAARVTYRAFSSLSPDLRRAAYATGATPFQVLRWVATPAASGKLARGALRLAGRMVVETTAVYLLFASSPFWFSFPALDIFQGDVEKAAAAAFYLTTLALTCFITAEILKSEKTD